jgi:predicted enzyme related to lactoylglutathione lyase
MSDPVVHFEICGPNSARLAKFYGDVFQWQIRPGAFDNHFEIAQGGAGALPGSIKQEYRASRVLYIRATNLENTLDRIRQAGGCVVIPPTNVPGLTYALFEDPDGNRTGLLKPR